MLHVIYCMNLELLSPAKNLEFGREAINHGADALYIGAPAFGARAAATNSMADIEELVRYAHLFGAKVFTTVNTLLFDDEIDDAVRMINQLYNIGVDALIIQDLGLLECDLPPIELHASTQCHNSTMERVKFMESVGFSRVILARETSIAQMREISKSTKVDLEAFIHGALCVSYSGQCYMSQYLAGRSGNRGCCSQPCRSSYDLYAQNTLTGGLDRAVLKDRHLLSLRDFNASQHIGNMVDAGITSFKIEGRLKDIGYVKNITAYYRKLLDDIMDGGSRSSSGRCTYYFTPDVERTFNRGYTDYFLLGRQKMANIETPKALGKKVGKVSAIGHDSLTIKGDIVFNTGDGLCYIDADGRMQGFLVNKVDGQRVVPNNMPDIKIGTMVWRNHDHAFEKALQGKSAERRIDLHVIFNGDGCSFYVTLVDEDGCTVECTLPFMAEEARDAERNCQQIIKQLSRMGDTPFVVTECSDVTNGRWFLPTSVLNKLRRDAVDALTKHRIKHFHPKDKPYVATDISEWKQKLDYRANIVNSRSEQFYKRHGACEIERGLEQTLDYDGKALMTTKYCLRYELGCCLKGGGGGGEKNPFGIAPTDKLVLHNNGRRFRLEFDCGECLMRIYKD